MLTGEQKDVLREELMVVEKGLWEQAERLYDLVLAMKKEGLADEPIYKIINDLENYLRCSAAGLCCELDDL